MKNGWTEPRLIPGPPNYTVTISACPACQWDNPSRAEGSCLPRARAPPGSTAAGASPADCMAGSSGGGGPRDGLLARHRSPGAEQRTVREAPIARGRTENGADDLSGSGGTRAAAGDGMARDVIAPSSGRHMTKEQGRERTQSSRAAIFWLFVLESGFIDGLPTIVVRIIIGMLSFCTHFHWLKMEY